MGPRPIRQGEPLHGRDREVRELFQRMQAHRLVVLHSPSGAGKSSLVQAGLIPMLREHGFDVWNPIRVNLDPAELSGLGEGAVNRYLLSAMISLESELPEARRRSAAELARLDFETYLSTRPRRKGRERQAPVLLFDQFEEALTVAPWAIEEKIAFFRDIGRALDSGARWALFVIREDYLGAFAPYRDLIPTHLTNTFRLDLLEIAAGCEVAEKLAQSGLPPRAFPAARRLMSDLAMVQVQRADGTTGTEQGRYVEPVYLQVVCRRLWAQLPPGDPSIDEEDVEQLGDVTHALAEYYAAAVAKIAGGDVAVARALREWVGRKLISGGIRSLVRQEKDRSAGLDNGLIRGLVESYLVRAEPRGGSVWYELCHDRLVAPVTKDNESWEREHLSAMQVQARLWEGGGRAEGLLLRAEQVEEARAWARANPGRVTDVERDFLARSEQREAQEAARRRLRRSAVSVLAVAAVALAGLLVWALNERRRAEFNAGEARRNEEQARANGQVAERRLVSSLEEQARTSYLAGSAGVAMLYAGRARAEGGPSTLRSTILGLARKSALDAQIAVLPGARNAVAVSGDGTLLLIAGADRRVRFWDLRDVAQPARLHESEDLFGHVNAVALGSDGRLAATGGSNGVVRLWDLAVRERPKLLAPLLPAGAAARAVAFDPVDPRRLLVAGSDDGLARIWDVADPAHPRPRIAFRAPGRVAAASAVFAPDGKTVALAADRSVLLYDARTAKLLRELTGHDAAVTQVAFSPAGGRLVSGSDDRTARVWDPDTGRQLLRIDVGGVVAAVAFYGDGKAVERVVTAGTDLRIWDVQGGAPHLLVRPEGHEELVRAVVFGPDGKWLATASEDGTARLFHAGAGLRVQTLAAIDGQAVHGVAVNPRRPSSVALAGAAGEAQLWDLSKGGEPEVTRLQGHEGIVTAVRWSRDGDWLVTAGADGLAKIWDCSHPDDAPARIGILDGGGIPVRAIAISSDRQRIATARDDGAVWLWDVKDGANPRRLGDLRDPRGDERRISAVAFTPDGRRVIAGGQDQTVRVWDVDPRELLGKVPAPAEVASIDVSADGKRVLVAAGSTALEWDVSDPKQPRPGLTLPRHGTAVLSATYSHDGRRILTAAYDKLVRLWDAEGGKLLAELEGHDAPLTQAVFDPTDERALSAGLDGLVQIWDVRLETGDPRALDVLVRDRVPYHWEGDRVVAGRAR